MEDFKNIIDYLRFSRRSDEARAQNKHLSAVKVDSNFQNGIPHEEDIVVIEKSALKNNTEYQLLNDIADAYVNTLYVHEQPNDEIEYYIKKDFNENGNIVTKYKRVPLSNDGNENAWEEKDNTIFTRINVSGDFYYSHIENKFFLVFTEDVFLFQDVFAYSKNDLQDNKSGDYTFEYINERGRKKDPKSRRFNHTALKAKRTVNFNKGNDAGLVNLFPNIKGDTIQYNYFEKGVSFDSSLNKDESALTLKFGHFGALLEFLNQTIFYQLNEIDDFHTSLRKNFLDHYNTYISNLVRYYRYKGDELLTLIYFLPEPAFQHLDMLNLWDLVDGMLENSVTNIELLKEDILLKLLDVLYQNSKTHQIFLLELLKQNAKNKTRLERLIYRLDDKSNTALIKFIYDVWKNTKFVLPDTKQIPKYKETNGPLFLPYEAEKWAGFYFSNAKVNFNKQEVEIDFKTGKFEDVEIASPKLAGGKGTKKQEIIEHYTYHPFYPIYIKDVEKQDTLITFNSIIPAFMLFVNEDKAFWHNFIKTGEYTLDVVTTLSGIGNLAKFRHLTKLSKLGKAINYARKGAAIIEITSGTTNALLKLTEADDTPYGRALSEYLFYLEMLSLSIDVTDWISKGLKESASKVLEHSDDLKKHLDDLIKKGELDEASKFKTIDSLEDVAGIKAKRIDQFKQFVKKWNGNSIAKLTRKEIADNLKGFTEQANRVAKLIEKGDIPINILDEKTFIKQYEELGGLAEDADFIDAFAYGEKTYYKSTTPIDRFLSEVVHESTHAKDYIDGLNDIDNIWEKRARFYERAFQIATGQEKDFETIKELLEFINLYY
ncbi:hypothetical protein [Mesoflavibacter zeaxanthinifaciens]|uniref:hypothetical protein n=1 Tax=Mesoflavibacter zeaxanthinifaciens TaxID=393060 RepID=UPI003A8DC9DE